jgi:putative ABC transport system permease protein
MSYWNSLLGALESLVANKLRSALTVLGIVIGVGAVIAMLSIGRGAQNSITGSIEGIGTNLLFVVRGGVDEPRNSKWLTIDDAEALQDSFQAPSVIGVAPILEQGVDVTAQGESSSTQIVAVTPNYETVRNATMAEGEFINETHLLSRSAVVILGPTVADNLFGRHEGLVGESVRINGQPFRVIGVLEEKGGSGFTDEDDRVIVPLTTGQSRLFQRLNSNSVDMIIVQAADAESVPQASQEVSDILRARHRTGVGADDFTVYNQQDFLDTAATITGVLTIFLGGIAAISLLVGGIGIMNIMLVSVIERTREIGLRKALGATRRDIAVQFLVEAVTLTGVGGVLGVGLGLAAALFARMAFDFDAAAPLWSVLLGLGVSSAVGLLFGMWPALRAARQDPIEALRYE